MMTPPPDHVSADDLALLKAAIEHGKASQAVFAFVSQHLATRYAIGPGDTVNDEDGTIKRKEAPPDGDT